MARKFIHEEIKARVPSLGLSRFSFAPSHAVKKARRADERKEFRAVDEWIEENVYDWTTVNPVTFDFTTARKLALVKDQRDILKHVFTLDSEGLFPYRTIIWSQIKKSGKTQIAAAVGAYFAAQVEAPNIVLAVANDQEQSAGRIFGAMKPTFKALGADVPTAPNSLPQMRLDNGTQVRAIPNNYAGMAGENYGLTLWSELWAFMSERGRRLWDELMPVPTRKNSVRWVETYVGFEDESDLLLEQFLKVFQDTSEQRLAKGARVVKELEHIRTSGVLEDDALSKKLSTKPCCYVVEEEGLFYFHDHERRMPWQRGKTGDIYYKQQQKSLRRTAYIRLCENRWQKSEGDYLEPDWIERAAVLEVVTEDGIFEPMVLAIDASQRHDTTSVVGTRYRRESGRYEVVFCRVFDPHGEDIDLDETAAETVEGLVNQGLVVRRLNPESNEFELQVWYDPAQMHQVAMNLRKRGVQCFEFPQGTMRTDADTFLNQQFRDSNIDILNDPDLKAHLSSAKAREIENEQVRIVKGTRSNAGHVDAAVAASMAVWRCHLLEADDTQEGEFSIVAQDTVTGWQ